MSFGKKRGVRGEGVGVEKGEVGGNVNSGM